MGIIMSLQVRCENRRKCLSSSKESSDPCIHLIIARVIIIIMIIITIMMMIVSNLTPDILKYLGILA